MIKCKDCKFWQQLPVAPLFSRDGECRISLPSYIVITDEFYDDKRTYGDDGCDLGQPKEE